MRALADWFARAYRWVKDNDLPNTFTLFVTLILWPLALLWWQTRKTDSISNLLVAFTPRPDHIVVNGAPYPAVDILFENQTGSIIYVIGPRVRNCSKLFPVPMAAVRDIGENVHPLSFYNPTTGLFEHHQTTLQTSGKAQTVMPVTTAMQEPFYRYKTPWLRRIFKWRKYFILEYTAMIGENRYRVSTIR